MRNRDPEQALDYLPQVGPWARLPTRPVVHGHVGHPELLGETCRGCPLLGPIDLHRAAKCSTCLGFMHGPTLRGARPPAARSQ